MAETVFFKQRMGLTIGEIATLTGATARAGARLDDVITSVAPLDRAGPADLAFLDSGKYAASMMATHAGACLMTERFESQAPTALNVLRAAKPYNAFVVAARNLFPDSLRPSPLFKADAVDPTAVVHPSASLGPGVSIDPGAVIGPRATIGAGSVVGANAVIGADVTVGRDCSIGPGVSLIHSVIGDNVICHPGCRIGQDGFRYLVGPNGHTKVPQLGRVVIGDNVEIGAGTTIDRGGSGDTTIGNGTKIDNLVHIAHNVVIGRHCIIAGQCGLAGSVVLGDFVMLGGQVGIADHLIIGDGAMVGAKSGVMSNIPAGEKWLGFPAWPGRNFLRAMMSLRKSTGEDKNR